MTLYYSVVVFSLIMMTVSLVALFIADSNDQLMGATWSFLGWSTLGSILICSRK
jgi:hypothetical protein